MKLLRHKPRILGTPLAIFLRHGNLKIPQKRRNEFIHFEERNIFPNTRSRSRTELQHGPFHFFELIRRGFDPSLRAEGIDVFAKDFGPAVDDPGVAADNGASWDVFAGDFHALGWDDAFQEEAGGRVHAEGFLDDGVEIGEFLGFRPADFGVFAFGDSAVLCGFVELLHEFVVDTGMFDEVVEDAAQADGGGFRSGEDHTRAGGKNLFVGHELWVVVLGLGEFHQKVHGPARLLVHQAILLDLFHFCCSVCRLFQRKFRHGEDFFVDSPFLQLESERILFPDQIDKGHLAHGGSVCEESAHKCNDSVHVLIALHEAQALTPCQLSDDIECEELHPFRESAAAARVGISFASLFNKGIHRRVHQWLVAHHARHGKGVVDAAAILGVVILILCAEQ